MQIILSNDYTAIKEGLLAIASPNWATKVLIGLTIIFWLLERHSERSYKNSIKKDERARNTSINYEIDRSILDCMYELIDPDPDPEIIVNAVALKKQIGNYVHLINNHSSIYKNLNILNFLHKFKVELENQNNDALFDLAFLIVDILESKEN
ncbi:hypothetical protein NRK67_12105 [Fusobacteria bacterium ZRK30]|nr:hypothetical protein NRK67_12105 [Fusobacteria bacterium ZRK30]